MKTAEKKPSKKPATFADFLDTFPRSALTFDQNVARRDKKGITVEEFVKEGEARGVRLKVGTTYKWRWKGAVPRSTKRDDLAEAFKPEGIPF